MAGMKARSTLLQVISVLDITSSDIIYFHAATRVKTGKTDLANDLTDKRRPALSHSDGGCTVEQTCYHICN